MKKENLGQYEISEAFVKKGRLYVRVHYGDKRVVIPRAVYFWLKYNPCFVEVPQGYVIHHLDGDELNDDPSNLALMHKFHHTAYHWKHKRISTTVIIDNNLRTFYIPTQIPKAQPMNGGKRFRLQFYERNNNGSRNKKINVSVDDEGNPFFTKEDAEKHGLKIWEISKQIIADT
ncbi:MAG: hypothetical protein A4E71_02933 [Smithella sp. PtaU1.Bin162]|nr:MAG: hypothetical protein A4E71_02933 [Smithella sp. PtaU1.Bin162]